MSKIETSHRKIPWTDAEDQFFLNVGTKFLQQGRDNKEVCRYVSEKLGRTFYACSFRWFNTIKPLLPENLKSVEVTEEDLQVPKSPFNRPKKFEVEITKKSETPIHTYSEESAEDTLDDDGINEKAIREIVSDIGDVLEGAGIQPTSPYHAMVEIIRQYSILEYKYNKLKKTLMDER